MRLIHCRDFMRTQFPRFWKKISNRTSTKSLFFWLKPRAALTSFSFQLNQQSETREDEIEEIKNGIVCPFFQTLSETNESWHSFDFNFLRTKWLPTQCFYQSVSTVIIEISCSWDIAQQPTPKPFVLSQIMLFQVLPLIPVCSRGTVLQRLQ